MSEIGELCLSFYSKSIPAKGKPKPGDEWTVYSAIVQETGSGLTVVAAGTGSKVSYYRVTHKIGTNLSLTLM